MTSHEQPLEAGLYIVGTPIGHLGDMTARGIETLKAASLILAEDTRTTRNLLNHFEIKTHCISCHKFNEAQRCGEIISRIRNGEAVAMVTDSGMPCISDPGARIVEACRAAGVMITSAPGPTAVTTALALSGFGGHGFLFAGFLPRKSGARQKILEPCAALPVPVIFYESPYRLLKLLEEIEAVMGAERSVFVARELTKKFEELLSGTPAQIRQKFGERTVKGECVVIIDSAK
jgi:16S rRNA (cytidine1402-2'-O)-methyltransferase